MLSKNSYLYSFRNNLRSSPKKSPKEQTKKEKLDEKFPIETISTQLSGNSQNFPPLGEKNSEDLKKTVWNIGKKNIILMIQKEPPKTEKQELNLPEFNYSSLYKQKQPESIQVLNYEEEIINNNSSKKTKSKKIKYHPDDEEIFCSEDI